MTPEQAAAVLSSAYRRRITAEQVRQIAENLDVLRADGTFSLIAYTAALAGEVTHGGDA